MITKKELSMILSKRSGKMVTVKEIEQVGSGYHSDGYRVVTSDGEKYFIKRARAEDIGFEFPERKVMSLLVSHSMAKRAKMMPGSLGVIIKNESIDFVPEISESSEIYHLQEYGGEGKSYSSMLSERLKRKTMTGSDKEEIDKVLDFITVLHAKRHPSTDQKKLNSVYNDAMRAIIGHPERLLEVLQTVPDDSPLLGPRQQGEFITLMLENMHHSKNRHDRVSALHGDFWGANVFFRPDGSLFVIDYSRTPWGEPGHDVGIWMSQYLFYYYLSEKNKYFCQLGNYFLDGYIKRTRDKEVMNTLVYTIGLVAAIYASPGFKGLDQKVRNELYGHVIKMLRKKKFFWE
jgi:hypothetical protein